MSTRTRVPWLVGFALIPVLVGLIIVVAAFAIVAAVLAALFGQLEWDNT